MAGPELSIAVAAGKVLFSKSSFDFFSKWSLDSCLLETLETQFISAKALLNVADMSLMEQGSEHYKLVWKLRFAILDAEDLLDTIQTDNIKEKCRLGDSVGTVSPSVIKEKLRYKGKEIGRAFHPSKKTRETEMIEMIQQLQSLKAQVTSLNLDKYEALTEIRNIRNVCGNAINPLSFIDRPNDEKNIMNLLNSREGSVDELRVISITGMGGIGKTTLASKVYDGYQTLDQVFQVKAWVCVSDEFIFIDVIKSLLEYIERDSKSTTNLEAIKKELKEKLQGKRFLLVLDDIWGENGVEVKWESLLNIFSVGAPGSRIIVTTRAEQVATMVSNSHEFIYKLDGLSDDDCWSLFERLALPNGKSREYPRLEKIGRELVSRCKGLPLAVKMLGRALSNKKDEQWDFALHSKIWKSTSEIIPSLWFSYFHLPPPVKQCFGYFSMFPKDHVFYMDKMVMLWVSEGFIEKPQEGSRDDYEFVARSYFDYLIDNFFIEQSRITESGFVMHDLIHDLAEFVSKELVVDFANINSKSRRLPYIQDHKELFNTASVRNLPHLRTYRLRPCTNSDMFSVNKLCNTLLSNFKQLRVLSLEGYNISVLPASIKDMKLLRYLNLSGTRISYLPEWICSLYNLQVLNVSNCFGLRRFPKGFGQLTNLRHLIAKYVPFEEFPYGIKKMKSLRTVPHIFVSKGRSKELTELSELGNLHGQLRINGLNNVDDEQDVVNARFGNKEYLEELVLKWNGRESERDPTLDERVLDAVQPCGNLKRLTINTFYGKRLANWMTGDSPSLSNMVVLRLVDCCYCEALPSMGSMRCLKSLTIEGLDSVEYIGIEFNGNSDNPFPSLQVLNISSMEKLKSWILPVEMGKKGFCSLKELEIKQCCELISIPYCFPNLAKLKIDRCNKLVKMQMHGAEEKGSLSTSRPYGYSLQFINITYCPMLEEISKCFICLTEVFIFHCESLALVPMFHNVRELYLRHVGDLVPPEGAIQNSIMENLTIVSSSNFKLTKLLSEQIGIFSRFAPLGTLDLEVRDVAINSDDDTEEMIGSQEDGEVVSVVILPPSLTNITIFGLSDNRIVTQISQLKCLTWLEIRNCHALVLLPDLTSLSMLETLIIGDFISLTTFPDGFLSSYAKRLKLLKLSHFPNLACLPEVFLTLKSLSLERCPLIQCFPASIDSSLSELDYLLITDCPMLESLPRGFHNITTLQEVHLRSCPSLVFPEYGFPATITNLTLENCGKMEPISKMNLSKLTSLKCLELNGFPETVTLDGCIPASVEILVINNFPHLISKSGVYPTLNRLEHLETTGCPLLNKTKSWSNTLKDIPTEFKLCLCLNSHSTT